MDVCFVGAILLRILVCEFLLHISSSPGFDRASPPPVPLPLSPSLPLQFQPSPTISSSTSARALSLSHSPPSLIKRAKLRPHSKTSANNFSRRTRFFLLGGQLRTPPSPVRVSAKSGLDPRRGYLLRFGGKRMARDGAMMIDYRGLRRVGDCWFFFLGCSEGEGRKLGSLTDRHVDRMWLSLRGGSAVSDGCFYQLVLFFYVCLSVFLCDITLVYAGVFRTFFFRYWLKGGL